MTHQPNPYMGIGSYRMLGERVHESLQHVISGARNSVANGVTIQSRFNHDAKPDGLYATALEDPKSYTHPTVVNSDDEIIEALKHRWDHVAQVHSRSHAKILLEEFGTESNILDFCFLMVKNEIDLIQKVYPVSEDQVKESLEKLEEKRRQRIEQECQESMTLRVVAEKRKQLISDNDIEGFARLEGNGILQKRISGNSFNRRSEYSWEDIRVFYGIDKKQLRIFRQSVGYHEALAKECKLRVANWRANLRRETSDGEQVMEEGKIPMPGKWFNERIIDLSGAIGFTEPSYDE